MWEAGAEACTHWMAGMTWLLWPVNERVECPSHRPLSLDSVQMSLMGRANQELPVLLEIVPANRADAEN